MRQSLKKFFQSQKDSMNAAYEQKTSLAQKKLVQTSILLTLISSSRRRLNKYYFRLKRSLKNRKKDSAPIQFKFFEL